MTQIRTQAQLMAHNAQRRWTFWLRRIARLPSVETQTLEWFRFDTAYGPTSTSLVRSPTNLHLVRAGFRLYVRSEMLYHQERVYWTLTIGSVEIPEAFRGRGWFKNYLEMVYHTMPHDALLIQPVINERLFAFFTQRPEYIPIDGKAFLRLRTQGRDMPLSWATKLSQLGRVAQQRKTAKAS